MSNGAVVAKLILISSSSFFSAVRVNHIYKWHRAIHLVEGFASMSKSNISLIQIAIFLITAFLAFTLALEESPLLSATTFVLGVSAVTYLPAIIRNRANGSFTNKILMVLILSALIAAPIAGYGLVSFFKGQFFIAIACLYLAWAVAGLIIFFFGVKHGMFYEEK